MTATANCTDTKCIQESLGLKKCKVVVANSDRKNIYYGKVYRHCKDSDAIQTILMPVARGISTYYHSHFSKAVFPYKLFEYVLGSEQYFPVDSAQVPSNRLFAHASCCFCDCGYGCGYTRHSSSYTC